MSLQGDSGRRGQSKEGDTARGNHSPEKVECKREARDGREPEGDKQSFMFVCFRIGRPLSPE